MIPPFSATSMDPSHEKFWSKVLTAPEWISRHAVERLRRREKRWNNRMLQKGSLVVKEDIQERIVYP